MPNAVFPNVFQFRAYTQAGSLVPLAGGYLYFYAAGTTNPQAAYTDTSGTVPLPNPLQLDANGSATFCLLSTKNYKINLTDSLGVIQNGYPIDNIVPDDALNQLASTATGQGANLIGYLAPYAHAVGRTLQSWMNDSVNAATWGLVGDGVTDNTAAWANCLTDCAGKTIRVNPGTYITAPFTVPDNTTIIGDGMRTTTFKMKAGSNGNLLSNAGASGSNVVLEKLTLDGNNGSNTSGRVLYFVTNNASDGPALVMRDVEMTFAPAGLSDSSSAFVSGLAWVHWDNVRFVNNNGTLWLSTNDSTFHALYLGNAGVSANVPGMVVGGSSNKFESCYFGGNGAATTSTASQVKIIGGQHNYFIACVNDSANGHGYEFIDNGAVYCLRNQIIGGVISNPSQNTTNTSYHVLFSGNSGYNQIIGAAFFNDLAKVGKFAVAEIASANHNLIQSCYMGTFGTAALATISANGTRVLDCPGLTPQGVVNITPGASPYTYTNVDNVREAIYITGGTVSNISKNAVGLATTTPLTVWLEPGESLTVTYTVAPTMNADRK